MRQIRAVEPRRLRSRVDPKRPVLAIHGGAGVIRGAVTARHRAGLRRALQAGWKILDAGGASLDAVTAAVVVLEDDPLFNAGRGAVYNAEAKHELDAAIMDGATLRAGAVAAVSRIRNPVLAARAVMERSPHGGPREGAEQFASRQKIRLVRPGYFHTAARRAALRKGLEHHHGTVGAVALDREGNLAAATSTGGFTGKLPGRVGDRPSSARHLGGQRDVRRSAPATVSSSCAAFLLTTLLRMLRRRVLRRARSPPSPHRAPGRRAGSSRSTAAATSRRPSTVRECFAPARRDGTPRIEVYR